MRPNARLALIVLIASQPALAEEEPGWRIQPSAHTFATWEWSRGEWLKQSGVPRPGPAAGVGVGLEAERRSDSGELRLATVGSLRHHGSAPDWSDGETLGYSLWFAGHTAWVLSPRARVSLEEDARAERLPGLGNLIRNQVSASLSRGWGRRGALVLKLADRRRFVDRAPRLGFARQTVALGGSLALPPRQALGLEIGVQPYQADTARGERLLLSAEYSRVSRGGVTALRAAFWEPLRDRRGPQAGTLPELLDTNNASLFLERNGLPSPGITANIRSDFVAEAFFLDSYLENDADEWDFGRRKWQLVLFHSSRLGGRTSMSLLARAQFRRGPDLLTWGETIGSESDRSLWSFDDTRLFARVLLRHRLSRELTLVAQAVYLDSRSDHEPFEFSRGLVGLGFQWSR